MNKEEILAKSRAERKDEGTEYILSRGRIFGVAGMTFMYLALIIFNFVFDKDNSCLFAVYWMFLGFEYMGRYRASQKRADLITSVIGIIAGVCFAAAYVISVVR